MGVCKDIRSNNNINSYQITNNLYISILSGNFKYLNILITSLSDNSSYNYLLKLDAQNTYLTIGNTSIIY